MPLGRGTPCGPGGLWRRRLLCNRPVWRCRRSPWVRTWASSTRRTSTRWRDRSRCAVWSFRCRCARRATATSLGDLQSRPRESALPPARRVRPSLAAEGHCGWRACAGARRL